jgi:hypothetical protein
MHDGGTDIKLWINDKLVCKSMMRYGGRAGYTANSTAPVTPAPSHGHTRRDDPGHGGSKSKSLHISDPGLCENFGKVKKGDVMRIEAAYDSDKYPLMTHNGKRENLMGNMRVYIGPDKA